VERSFGTAQNRLVKGLRVAGARTIEDANRYLEEEFVPWWNQHLVIAPEHDLAASLSQVETRQVANDYTIQFDGKLYQIERASICAGLRSAVVRVERRLDGTLTIRFRDRRLTVAVCAERPRPTKAIAVASKPRSRKPPKPSPALRAAIDHLFDKPGPPIWAAARGDRTRTRDKLD
jgi:hypothetical protein